MQPLLKILLDTKRIKQKTGKYPVKLRVTFGKEQKQYPIDIDLSTEEFNLVENPGDIEKGVSPTNKRQVIMSTIKSRYSLILPSAQRKKNWLINC